MSSDLSGGASAGSHVDGVGIAGTEMRGDGGTPPKGGTGSSGSPARGGATAGGGRGGAGGTDSGSEGGDASSGCVSDGEPDADGDGRADCGDGCPNDPKKLEPGACGCGIPDSDTAEMSGCASLRRALLHRYDFEGVGTEATDRVGGANGTVVGTELMTVDGAGELDLSGGLAGPYVDLPNGLISSLHELTLEAWVTWRGGGAWQRVFDFGSSSAMPPEDTQARGKSYVFLSVVTPPAEGQRLRAAYLSRSSTTEQLLDTVQSMPRLRMTHVALTVSEMLGELAIYVNGEKDSSGSFSGKLAEIDDVNVWLGRSQFLNDEEINAALHEARIYGTALTAAQLRTSYAAGPDPAFLESM